MKNVKTAVDERMDRSAGEGLTQTVRINGEIRKIAVGSESYRLGQENEDGELDLTANITDEDLLDVPSGIGKELAKSDTLGTAMYHQEISMAARSGVQARTIDRRGASIHIAQAIDSAEEELGDNLIAGWERDPDFSAVVAEYVQSTYGFDLDMVLTAIRNRSNR